MPFENNGTIQKWYFSNNSPKIDKYSTKMAHLPKIIPNGYLPWAALYLKGNCFIYLFICF